MMKGRNISVLQIFQCDIGNGEDHYANGVEEVSIQFPVTPHQIDECEIPGSGRYHQRAGVKSNPMHLNYPNQIENRKSKDDENENGISHFSHRPDRLGIPQRKAPLRPERGMRGDYASRPGDPKENQQSHPRNYGLQKCRRIQDGGG